MTHCIAGDGGQGFKNMELANVMRVKLSVVGRPLGGVPGYPC
jgi:hypothetical protein